MTHTTPEYFSPVERAAFRNLELDIPNPAELAAGVDALELFIEKQPRKARRAINRQIDKATAEPPAILVAALKQENGTNPMPTKNDNAANVDGALVTEIANAVAMILAKHRADDTEVWELELMEVKEQLEAVTKERDDLADWKASLHGLLAAA